MFKKYENGEYTKTQLYSTGIETKHPNLFRVLVMTKKSWGLWKNQWAEGVIEGTFLRSEIISIFEDRHIKIPEPFLNDFLNTVRKGKLKNFMEFYK